MAQQIINVGAAPNDGQGDPIRTAFQKTNSNFTELYARAQTLPPVTLTGQDGDVPGMYAYDSTYFYYCFDTWDGSSIIWAQVTQVGNISTNQIVSGNSNVVVTGAGGTVTVGVGGTNNIAVFTTTGANITGNVAASGYVLGNGSLLTGLPATYANANVQAYAESGWSGNIVPAANAVYNLGSASNQWKSLYVSNTTIYLGNVPIGIGAGNTLTVNGQAVLSNDSNANITTTGNVAVGAILTDGYFFANGAPFVASSEYGNANVVANLAALASNPISTAGNISAGNVLTGGTVSATGNILTGGLISATGNITGGYIFGNGSGLTNLPAPAVTQDISSNGAMSIMIYDGNIKYNNYATVEPSSGNITGGNILTGGLISATGNITGNYFIGDGSQLTNLPGGGLPIANGTSNFNIATANGNVTVTAAGAYTWTFDDTGNMTFPSNGQIVMDGGDGTIGNQSDDFVISWDNEEIRLVSVQGSIEMQADSAFRVQTNYDGGNAMYASRWEFSNNELVNITNNFGIVSEAGSLLLSGGRDGVNSGNATVRAVNVGVAVYDWTFDSTGVLTLPGEGVLRSIGDSVTLQSINVGSGNANSVYLSSSGGLGFFDQEIGTNWLQIFRSGAEPEITIPFGYGNANLYINNSSSGNVLTWTFGADGTFTAPGNISAVGDITGLISISTPVPLANLVAVAGGRAFVTDANLVAAGNFGANISGGGSNTVPVWSDGTNWYIG